MGTSGNMKSIEQPPSANTKLSALAIWQKRFFVIATMIGGLVLIAMLFWLMGQIIEPIIYVLISAILAYVLSPLVGIFERFLPRPLAILTTLLIVAGIIIFLVYIICVVAIQQIILLVAFIQTLLKSPTPHAFSPLINFLNRAGISPSSFHFSLQQGVDYLRGFLDQVGPLVTSVINVFLTLLLVTTLCIYFLIDGGRLTRWLRQKTPMKMRPAIIFFLNTSARSMGGFIRGQLLLATIVSLLIGAGAFLLGIPYAALIMVLVFVFEFIPIIGPYISGILGILLALTHGWQSALLMTGLVILVQQVIDGQILSPRILGHSVGLHPIVAIFALLVGGKLFGLLGAFLSAPVAGILQSFIVSLWLTWREQHPEQFPEEQIEQTELKQLSVLMPVNKKATRIKGKTALQAGHN